MSDKSNAQKHAEIAKSVWPDAEVEIISHNIVRPWAGKMTAEVDGRDFDLLATNPDGTPTTQAKSDALDVLVFLANDYLTSGELALIMASKHPCQAIFNAAWEVVKNAS